MFTQGTPQRKQQQAEKEGEEGNISQSEIMAFLLWAAMVTESADIHMVKMGPEWDMSWTGSALCFRLKTCASIQKC